MRYFSTFSGIGGFELGIKQAYEDLQELCIKNEGQSEGASPGNKEGQCEQLHKFGNEGLSCIGYSEIDKYAIQVYEKHFKHKNYGDITKINARELPDFDLMVGGFPCQSFSIAGKRGGFHDTRGTLFFDLARICAEKRPRLVVFENVKGLLSHDQGKTFQTILGVLSDLGYGVQWQVLNSKNFGVPQNRERVFIIGHLRGTSRPEVFPIGGGNSKTLKQIIGGGQGNRVYDPSGVSVTQASQAGGQGAKTGLYFVNEQRFRDYKVSKISQSVKVVGDIGKVIQPVLTPDRARIRRLTPTECERLQGFPDGWTEKGVDIDGMEVYISDTQRYRSLGNAVTTNVIKEIICRLVK